MAKKQVKKTIIKKTSFKKTIPKKAKSVKTKKTVKTKAKANPKMKTNVKPKVKPPQKAKAKAVVRAPLKKAAKAPTKASAKAAVPSKVQKKSSNLNLNLLVSPLDDRLLVQIVKEDKITAGGIIIPDTSAITGNLSGVVVAVGRGHRDDKGKIRPMDVKVGDHVLVSESAGDNIEISGHKVQILRESDVLGILE